MQDQLSSTGAYLWSQMRRGLCPPGPRSTWVGGGHLNRRHNSNTVQGRSLASLLPRVTGCEVFGALLCVCQVNTLFRCFDVTDRKSLSCVVFVIEQQYCILSGKKRQKKA